MSLRQCLRDGLRQRGMRLRRLFFAGLPSVSLRARKSGASTLRQRGMRLRRLFFRRTPFGFAQGKEVRRFHPAALRCAAGCRAPLGSAQGKEVRRFHPAALHAAPGCGRCLSGPRWKPACRQTGVGLFALSEAGGQAHECCAAMEWALAQAVGGAEPRNCAGHDMSCPYKSEEK